MKKIFVLILSLALIFAVLIIPTQAASYSSVDDFKLSKQNLTASGKNFSYNQNGINFSSYVQHWKGNTIHADTARTQIKTATNVSNTRCVVKIYVNGEVNSSNTDATYAETATGLWQTVQRTYHLITLTGSTGNTYKYEANGGA